MKKVTNANFLKANFLGFGHYNSLDSEQFLQVLSMTKKTFVSPSEQRKIHAFELRYHPHQPTLLYQEIAKQLNVSSSYASSLTNAGAKLFCRRMGDMRYREEIIPAIPRQTLEKIESLRRGPLYLVVGVATNSMCLEPREKLLYQKLVGFRVNIDFTVTQMTEEEIAEFYR